MSSFYQNPSVSKSPWATARIPASSSGKVVLMTGGTGFLGLHLLRGFLFEGHHVRLLAHAGQISAMKRIRQFLQHAGELDQLRSTLETSLTIFDIDIAKPDLGLGEADRKVIIQSADEMWHIAATVMLDGRADHVWHTNVAGTEHVLCLFGQAPAHAVYRHVSTAFVAGSDRLTDVSEDACEGVHDFENMYEHSKHAAEAMVRRWALKSSRSALIFRPSILVPSAAFQDGLPEHTMRTVGQIVTSIVERSKPDGSRTVLRLGADPRAHLNLLQVDWAATTMQMLARRITTGVETVHVVHDTDVPVRSLSAALEQITAVRMRMMPALPAEPTDEERLFYRRIRGFLPYCYHRRRFSTTKLQEWLPELRPPATIRLQDLALWMHNGPHGSALETIDEVA